MLEVVNKVRTAAILSAVRPQLDDGDRIVDVGAGSCHVAQTLHGTYGFDVAAIDVVDHNITPMPLALYDGKRLPYADGEFDVALLLFVLHHAPDAAGLLAEATRVAKKVIILEDTPANALEARVWRKLDYLENHAQHADVHVAHEAKSVAAWQTFFGDHGCRTLFHATFRRVFTTARLYPHTIFVVSPAHPRPPKK